MKSKYDCILLNTQADFNAATSGSAIESVHTLTHTAYVHDIWPWACTRNEHMRW